MKTDTKRLRGHRKLHKKPKRESKDYLLYRRVGTEKKYKFFFFFKDA